MNLNKIFLSMIVTILVVTQVTGVSASSSEVVEPILRVENQRISNDYFTDLDDEIEQLKELDEGTIIVRFRHTGSSIMSLFSLSNKDLPDGHFHLYLSPTAVGSENRYEKPGEPKENIHIRTEVTLKQDEVYTLAMVLDKNEGYKFFLDGELIIKDTQSPRKFLSNIYEPNSAQLGRTERAAGRNPYYFSGDIDVVEIYSHPLSDETLTNITSETVSAPIENPMPDDAYVTDPQSVFYPGFMNSDHYRIPALLYTKNGTLLAGIDRRVGGGHDSPNDIDAVVRRSLDQGHTWEEDGIVINDYPDEASNIDLSFLQDKTSGRIFALVDGFPHGAGLMGGFGTNAYKGTGFKEINGKKYMFLTDENGDEYTIREEGRVYNHAGELTSFSVDMKRNLYQDGEQIDHIFSKTSPLKPFKTSYLELYYSDDEGETWTGPIDLNDQVKEEWMIFLGTGPGNGIQLKQEPYKGRLVFPVYFINDRLRQASAVIYSDDNGETWHRGESPNEGRVVENGEIIREKDFTNPAHEITESQVVEMPDGQLKLFMRNHSGYAQIATSFDGGETWHPEIVTEKALVAPYSQMSAIRYNGQVDGKEAVVFSSANHPTSRINGTVRIGLIEEDGTYENGYTKYSFNWKYEQLIKEGHYGYSSLTNLSDGDIGLFYEGTANTEMDFIKFNTEYVKWQLEAEAPNPKLKSIHVNPKVPPVNRPGEKIQIEAAFDDYVMLIGNKQLTGTIGHKRIYFDLVEQTGHTHFVFEAVVPKLPPRAYTLEVEFDTELDIYNVYGNVLPRNEDGHKLRDIVRVAAKSTQ